MIGVIAFVVTMLKLAAVQKLSCLMAPGWKPCAGGCGTEVPWHHTYCTNCQVQISQGTHPYVKGQPGQGIGLTGGSGSGSKDKKKDDDDGGGCLISRQVGVTVFALAAMLYRIRHSSRH